jgi:SAM-dependent methyltransferase
MRCLNLGCGSSYHHDWINIDIVSTGPGVIAHDLHQGIPLPNASCDVVYHSHVLEHTRRSDALSFMQECYRVLKPGGIMRVVVPDLEQICHLYLTKLGAALKSGDTRAYDYEWIMLEMYDQTVRERSGGEMLPFLFQDPLANAAFVYERIGEEGRSLVRSLRCQQGMSPMPIKLSHGLWAKRLRSLPRRLRTLYDSLVARVFLSREGFRALEIGRFRLAGEVHQWMYDRYSLAQLMVAASFRDPVQQSATTSQIPHWTSFNLDTLPDGTVKKPDSLYMEAVKTI